MWQQAVSAFAYCSCCGIAHSDVKPSNILLVKDSSKASGYSLRVADFGTSISIPERKNEQLNTKEATFANLNKFMTPLYASPNIAAKANRVNYYLEDVFSLGVSFVQMAGPYTSDELATFTLNATAEQNHSPLLDMALNKCQSPLAYFHRVLLRKMLSPEAEDRPSFLELKEILLANQLALNLDNEGFVDGLLKDKIRTHNSSLRSANSHSKKSRGGDQQNRSRNDSNVQGETPVDDLSHGNSTMY